MGITVARCGDIPNFVAAAAIHDLTNAVRNGLEPAHGVHAVARLVMSKQAGVFTIWWKLKWSLTRCGENETNDGGVSDSGVLCSRLVPGLGKTAAVPSVFVALWYR